MQTGHDMELDTGDGRRLTGIGTLGPAGTSSEGAGLHLWRRLSTGPEQDPRVLLYDTFEAACDGLLEGAVSHLLVANAYRNINHFYMDTRLTLAHAFVWDTPFYGVAKPRGGTVPPRPTVASHPAPIPLLQQLMPQPYTVGDVTEATSTSTAARAARERKVDLALTTAPAAAVHDLEFISGTRRIRMLWSAFVRSRTEAHTDADTH